MEVEELAVQEPDGVETQPHLGVQDEPMRDDEVEPATQFVANSAEEAATQFISAPADDHAEEMVEPEPEPEPEPKPEAEPEPAPEPEPEPEPEPPLSLK